MKCVARDQDYLELDDSALLKQCDVQVHRASGPGGQRRNKVATAVRIVHKPTGISAHAGESRYQRENKQRAVARLRMNIACGLRRQLRTDALEVPAVVAECIFTPRGAAARAKRLRVGRKDRRFWPVAAFLLDLLAACKGSVSDAARCLGVTTANFVSAVMAEKHLLAAAQAIRKANGLNPLR